MLRSAVVLGTFLYLNVEKHNTKDVYFYLNTSFALTKCRRRACPVVQGTAGEVSRTVVI